MAAQLDFENFPSIRVVLILRSRPSATILRHGRTAAHGRPASGLLHDNTPVREWILFWAPLSRGEDAVSFFRPE